MGILISVHFIISYVVLFSIVFPWEGIWKVKGLFGYRLLLKIEN